MGYVLHSLGLSVATVMYCILLIWQTVPEKQRRVRVQSMKVDAMLLFDLPVWPSPRRKAAQAGAVDTGKAAGSACLPQAYQAAWCGVSTTQRQSQSTLPSPYLILLCRYEVVAEVAAARPVETETGSREDDCKPTGQSMLRESNVGTSTGGSKWLRQSARHEAQDQRGCLLTVRHRALIGRTHVVTAAVPGGCEKQAHRARHRDRQRSTMPRRARITGLGRSPTLSTRSWPRPCLRPFWSRSRLLFANRVSLPDHKVDGGTVGVRAGGAER